MTDFARAFPNDYNNISDAVEWDRSAVYCLVRFRRPIEQNYLTFVMRF